MFLGVDTYLLKEGIIVQEVEKPNEDTFKRKLIIANKCSFNGSFIDNGSLSICGTNNRYILGDNLELIQKILNFKLSKIIYYTTKYSQSFLSKEAFKYIPDLRKLGITDITEEEYYKLLGLSDDEIQQINNF